MRKRGWIIISVMVGVFATTGYVVSQKKASADYSSLVTRMQVWMQERKSRLNQNLKQVKQIAADSRNTNQEIHFEFYSSLPNVRVPVPEVVELKKAEAAAATPAVVKVATVAATATVTEKPAKTVKPLKTEKWFDAGALQQAMQKEFHQEVKVDRYILQLGVFSSAASAEKFRQSFARTGFATRVVKAAQNRVVVQAGPFADKNKVMSVQQELKGKNIKSIVRKL